MFRILAPEGDRFRVGALVTLALSGILGLVAFGATERGLDARRSASREFAADLEDLFTAAAAAVRPGVVAIDTTDAGSSGANDDENGPHTSFGSGFVIDRRGYVLTNWHLVGRAGRIRVRLHDGREYPGAFVRGDATSDIALVRIDAEDLEALALGDSGELRVGQWALAVGHPFGLLQTVSAGIISGLKRSDLHILPFEEFIQTDASINPGNSGGPLVNLRAEVIGINTAVFSTASSANHGISFAVPINLARALATRWIDGQSVAFLGLSPGRVDADIATWFGLSSPRGAFVRAVDAAGPADAAGIRAMDLIVTFDGETVVDENHLRLLTARQVPGRGVDVELHRGRDALTVRLVPGTRDDSGAPLASDAIPEPGGVRWLGVMVTTLSGDLRASLGVRDGTSGVAIVDVDRNTAAWRKGLRAGDVITAVNGEAIANLAELERRVATGDAVVAFTIERRGRDVGFFFVPRG